MDNPRIKASQQEFVKNILKKSDKYTKVKKKVNESQN